MAPPAGIAALGYKLVDQWPTHPAYIVLIWDGTQKDHCMDGEWEEREKARGEGVQQNNKGVAWEERGWTHSEC